MERLQVRVHAADGAVRDRMARRLRQAGLEPAPDGDRSPGQVVLLAAGTAGEALGGCPAPRRADGRRLVLAADVFGPADVRRAVRLGVRVMIRSDRASAAQLADAVHAARYGDGRIPYEVLTRVLGGPARPAGAEPSPWPLTARQTAVLALMAEGHAQRGDRGGAGVLRAHREERDLRADGPAARTQSGSRGGTRRAGGPDLTIGPGTGARADPVRIGASLRPQLGPWPA